MNQPLAALLRPKSIKDIVGQEKLLSKDGIIRRMVDNHFASNLIFYGPPGIGKTSFAIALANDLGMKYYTFNASIDKKQKLDSIFKETEDGKPIILIIDEVHRMNQNKQDILLEYMEEGKIVVFFTTTENPYFVMNPAIRSRSTILELTPINSDDIFKFLRRKIDDKEIDLKIADEPLKYLSELCGGDMRVAINKIELLTRLYKGTDIDLATVSKVFDNHGYQMGSKYGDTFYDLMSALQKSIRGSDPDAALYYMSRMLVIGDFDALLRRLVIIAYEDIGMANPAIPGRVYEATQVFRQVGMPEGLLPLGLAVVDMCLSEKSNSAAMASWAAMGDVEKGKIYDIPAHLKDAHYKSASKLKRGEGYKYPHDYPNDWVQQQYLPDKLKDTKYYYPKVNSLYESKVNKLYNEFKKNSKGNK